ncbi:MAG: YiiD C-terminal domain-containing protein [Candidatus Didemnitutus sp.]|nr:YiiD C-terminal domain-containing protein [Candidatus Didemnitutus sp.]
MALTPFQRFKYNLVLRFIAARDIPLIGTAGVRIVDIDDERCTIRVPLKRRNKNHLGSMYFGALAIGADAAGGLAALLENRRHGNAVNFVFQDFHADFLKRPEGDTHFTCADLAAVRGAFVETMRTGERVSAPLRVIATTPSKFGNEPVAEFRLTLSVKKRPPRQTG